MKVITIRLLDVARGEGTAKLLLEQSDASICAYECNANFDSAALMLEHASNCKALSAEAFRIFPFRFQTLRFRLSATIRSRLL